MINLFKKMFTSKGKVKINQIDLSHYVIVRNHELDQLLKMINNNNKLHNVSDQLIKHIRQRDHLSKIVEREVFYD